MAKKGQNKSGRVKLAYELVQSTGRPEDKIKVKSDGDLKNGKLSIKMDGGVPELTDEVLLKTQEIIIKHGWRFDDLPASWDRWFEANRAIIDICSDFNEMLIEEGYISTEE